MHTARLCLGAGDAETRQDTPRHAYLRRTLPLPARLLERPGAGDALEGRKLPKAPLLPPDWEARLPLSP